MVTATLDEYKTSKCEQCAKEFSYKYQAHFKEWRPKVCYGCKGKDKQSSSGIGNKALPKKISKESPNSISTGIFTDGGSRGNPGRGGWGFVYVVNNKVLKEGWGGEDYTTNNRMELTAIIEALKAVGNIKETLYSDSNISVQTYNEWMANWARNGWKKKGGPISNLDLVQELYDLKAKNPLIKLEWIKAHAGNRWNEYVDQLTQKY